MPTNEEGAAGGQSYHEWYTQRVQAVDAEYQKAMEISAKLMEELPASPGEYHDGVPLSARAMKSYEKTLQPLADADYHHSAYREAEIADAMNKRAAAASGKAASDFFLEDPVTTLVHSIFERRSAADAAKAVKGWGTGPDRQEKYEQAERIEQEARSDMNGFLRQLSVADPATYQQVLERLEDLNNMAVPGTTHRQLEEQRAHDAEVQAQREEAKRDTGHYDDGHSFGWTTPASGPTSNALTDGSELQSETERIERDLQIDHEERMAEPVPAVDGAAESNGRNTKVVVGAALAGALLIAVVVVALVSGGGSSSKTATAATNTDSSSSAVDDGPAASTPAAAGKPISYKSNCNGDCFMKVDPGSCDRAFHFDISLLGDVTKFEGKTAVISTVGPGLQPTYNVTVTGGKVVLDAVAPGASYGGNPNAACGANAHWSGLLTSVDGQPTITPNPPT